MEAQSKPHKRLDMWVQGDYHGCPYRVWEKDAVRAALQKMRVTPAKVEEAVNRAKGGHYQLACASAWEGAHRCPCDTGINHPNQVHCWVQTMQG